MTICIDFIKKYSLIILVFLIGFGFGYYLAPEKVVVQTKTEYVEVEGKTKTEVKYVQKENKSDADVEIKNNNPTVQINDKKYTLEKLPDEKYKFEDGKLQVEQGYSLKIDAKSLMPRQPKWGVDIGYSNHGYLTGIRYNFSRNISAFGMGVVSPVGRRDKFYGGGLTINF